MSEQSYIPRNHRPERDQAIAALKAYLDRHPDYRIGQALWAIAEQDPFQLEDGELIKRVAKAGSPT